MAKGDKALLDEAKKRFRQACEAEKKQRLREADDLRFQVPELQWDETARQARSGASINNITVPARPMMSVDLLQQPIQIVNNQYRNAHLGVDIHPLSEDADEDTAEVFQGIYRQIERQSQAHNARGWGFDRASKCGLGWYRVNCKYDDTGENPFDQVISIDRVLWQESIHIDPAAVKEDFSDARYAFISEWVPASEWKRKAGKNAKIPSTESFAEGEEPYWIKSEGEEEVYLLTEYYYKEHETKTFYAMSDGSFVSEDDLDEVPEGVEVDKSVEPREREVTVVKWCKHSSEEILDEEDWDGQYIPLVPCIWRELQPFDGERRWVGIIAPAKDAQRLSNFAISTAVEIGALEPKAPWLVTIKQIEGFESWWQQANTRNWPYLPWTPTMTAGGQPDPPPGRVAIDSNRLSVSLTLLEQARQGVMASTQIYDPGLGRTNQKEQSGKAIQALQGQGDQGNSHGLNNMADISMALEAKIVLDLIPKKYDRPGRILHILGDEGESTQVMLNRPYTVDPQTQRPQAVNQGAPGNGAPPSPPPGPVLHYDLRKGTYGVSVSIGKSWQSRLEQGSEEIGQILQSNPQLMPIIGPLYFKFRDFPGAKEIGELLGRVRDKQYPGIADKPGEPPSVESLQAQNQALQQQGQQQQQALRQAQQAIQTDQAKQQATIQKTQLETASRERIAAASNQNDVLLAKMNEIMELLKAGVQHGQDTQTQQQQMAHDVGMAGVEQIHAAHAAAMAPPAAPAAGVPAFTGPNPSPLGSEEGI